MFPRSLRMFPSVLSTVMLLLDAGCVQAAPPFVPTWIENDEAAHTVRLDIAAEWNSNNMWGNFNGYYKGNAKVILPAGWRVTIDFHMIGDHWPHSLMLTRPFDRPPLRVAESDAVDGVMTRKPIRGMEPGENDRLEFVAKPGNYWLVSAKGTDIIESKMWIAVEVLEGGKRAELAVDTSNAIATDVPGRQ